ncbi:MAG: hypothetical protein AAFQ43_09365 [Bacteroidota bacterium]
MLNKLPLFALLLALPLAACGTEETTDDATTTEDATVETDVVDDIGDDAAATDDAAPAVTAQATLDAVPAEGLTAMDPATAVGNIDAWIAALGDNPDAAGVVADLETLKGQLTADELDGAAIGGTLSSLGEQTTAVAGEDEALQTLGSALSSAGATLSGN